MRRRSRLRGKRSQSSDCSLEATALVVRSVCRAALHTYVREPALCVAASSFLKTETGQNKPVSNTPCLDDMVLTEIEERILFDD